MAPHSDSGSGEPRFADPIDAAHYAALIDRIDALMGCTEDSPEEEELARLPAQAEALEEAVG
jgi:hypothetical protein